MDPVQTRALNALEQFLALSKSANSPRAAADLITQATSARDTFVFAELLSTPNIQSLRQSQEYAGHLKVLEIFAWGTWGDYANEQDLPALNDQQAEKLRLLSLLTLASRPSSSAGSSSHLSYKALTPALGLSDSSLLESLVTTAIYRGLVTGTLDPANQLVSITSVSPLRDLAPGSIPSLLSTLTGWSTRCEDVVKSLEFEIERVRETAKKRKAEEKAFESSYEGAVKEVERKGKGGVGNGAAGNGRGHASEEEDDGEDAMEVDEGSGAKGLLGRGARRAVRGGLTFGR